MSNDAFFIGSPEWVHEYPPASAPRVRAAFRELDTKMYAALKHWLGTEPAMRHEKSGVDGNAVVQVVD